MVSRLAYTARTPRTWLRFGIELHVLSSYIKSVSFIKLHEVCKNQSWCNLMFADLLLKQLASSLGIKIIDTQLA